MKKTWIGLAVVAALVAATIGWSGQAPAQTKTDTPSASVPSAAPEKIEGTVTAIDARNGMVTLRGGDGQTHSARGVPILTDSTPSGSGVAPAISSGRSARSIRLARASTTPRSITFSSSRTLPGHE